MLGSRKNVRFTSRQHLVVGSASLRARVRTDNKTSKSCTSSRRKDSEEKQLAWGAPCGGACLWGYVNVSFVHNTA